MSYEQLAIQESKFLNLEPALRKDSYTKQDNRCEKKGERTKKIPDLGVRERETLNETSALLKGDTQTVHPV